MFKLSNYILVQNSLLSCVKFSIQKFNSNGHTNVLMCETVFSSGVQHHLQELHKPNQPLAEHLSRLNHVSVSFLNRILSSVNLNWMVFSTLKFHCHRSDFQRPWKMLLYFAHKGLFKDQISEAESVMSAVDILRDSSTSSCSSCLAQLPLYNIFIKRTCSLGT